MFEELQNASKNLEKTLQKCTIEIQSGKLKKSTQGDEEAAGFKRFQESPHERAKFAEQTFDSAEQRDRDAKDAEDAIFQRDKLEKIPKATQTNLPPPLSAISQNGNSKSNSRQDSNISSDSFSQNSSPSYTSKSMETPLLPQRYRIRGEMKV